MSDNARMANDMSPQEALAALRDQWSERRNGRHMFAKTREQIEAIAPLVENRWAAFTDEELVRVSSWYAFVEVVDTGDQALRAEIGSELERRRELAETS